MRLLTGRRVRFAVWLLATSCATVPGPAFTIHVDTSAAPECAAFAERSRAMSEAWYPKINSLLFEPSHQLPAKDVWLVFKPLDGVAETSDNRISISAEWVTKKAPEDYGMVIHELTHVVQHYEGKGVWWLTEGIADWVRDRHFEPGKRAVTLAPDSNYTSGYRITAAFLMSVEDTNPDAGIVRQMNEASAAGTYSDAMFQELTGKPLDELWREFVKRQSRDAGQ